MEQIASLSEQVDELRAEGGKGSKRMELLRQTLREKDVELEAAKGAAEEVKRLRAALAEAEARGEDMARNMSQLVKAQVEERAKEMRSAVERVKSTVRGEMQAEVERLEAQLAELVRANAK